MSHSPEPWSGGNTYVSSSDDDIVCQAYLPSIRSVPMMERKLVRDANTRRIAACVNACTGIPVELLEEAAGYSILPELTRRLESLLKTLQELDQPIPEERTDP